MSLPGKNSDLFRRLRFYGFGFMMGILIVIYVYKGKGCQLPGSRKLSELAYQKLELTKHGECRMKCGGITEADIKEILKTGKINYDKSDVQDTRHGTYAIEGLASNKQILGIVVADIDTISSLLEINMAIERDTCDCK